MVSWGECNDPVEFWHVPTKQRSSKVGVFAKKTTIHNVSRCFPTLQTKTTVTATTHLHIGEYSCMIFRYSSCSGCCVLARTQYSTMEDQSRAEQTTQTTTAERSTAEQAGHKQSQSAIVCIILHDLIWFLNVFDAFWFWYPHLAWPQFVATCMLQKLQCCWPVPVRSIRSTDTGVVGDDVRFNLRLPHPWQE